MRKSNAPSFLKSRHVSAINVPKENISKIISSCAQDNAATMRSTNRILNLLNACEVDTANPGKEHDKSAVPQVQHGDAESNKYRADTTSETQCGSSEKLVFEAVYRKMQTKKHKTWEGDGTVEIEGRCAILKDEDNKEIGRNAKVKAEINFVEGTQLVLGGKEVELGSLLTRQVVPRASSPTIQKPSAKKMKFMSKNIAENLHLPKPNASHQWKFNPEGLPVNDVVVEGFLARALRSHQREGIKFLYECVMGMRGPNCGQYWGGLLADEMGLGKTLQCIAVIWTLLNQKAYGRGGEIRRVLIVCPRTLVDNWERDIYAWLGYRRLSLYKVSGKNTFQDYAKKLSKVVLVSYESCVRQAAAVCSYEWDLLICDEAHCLKNPDTEKSKFFKSFKCQRRILLTGSPSQNNLLEFFELLNHANPGCLGTIEEFMHEYAAPILRSNEPSCSEEDQQVGEECSAKLKLLTSRFMLRRTAEILIPFLPSRQDLVVICTAADLQKRVYKKAVSYWSEVTENPKCLGYQSGVPVLKAITSLRQISNHPALVKSKFCSEPTDKLDDELEMKLNFVNNCDAESLDNSGKFQVVRNILELIIENNRLKRSSKNNACDRDRVLIVSYFTQTLTMLETLCKQLNCKYSRLDGNTPQNMRLPMVSEFNSKSSDTFVFLLSAKAGGTGLNLTGASRLILFDLDWNPANDAQALGRVWRGDQSRSVITYRLLTAGTIEEKMFQRQVKKTGLNPALNSSKERVKFSSEELKDLFSYEDNFVNSTHCILQCECDCTGNNLLNQDALQGSNLSLMPSEDLSIPGIDQLMRWQHFAPFIDPSVMLELELLYAQDKVTFVFRTVVDSLHQKMDV